MSDYALRALGKNRKGSIVYTSSVRLRPDMPIVIGYSVEHGADWSFGWFVHNSVSKESPLSRRHCELRIEEDVVLVRDLDSRTGTYIFRRSSTEQREVSPGTNFEVAEGESIGLIPTRSKKIPFRLEILVDKLSNQ